MERVLLLRMLETLRDNAATWYDPSGIPEGITDRAERDKRAWRLIAYYLAGIDTDSGISDTATELLDAVKAEWDEEQAAL